MRSSSSTASLPLIISSSSDSAVESDLAQIEARIQAVGGIPVVQSSPGKKGRSKQELLMLLLERITLLDQHVLRATEPVARDQGAGRTARRQDLCLLPAHLQVLDRTQDLYGQLRRKSRDASTELQQSAELGRLQSELVAMGEAFTAHKAGADQLQLELEAKVLEIHAVCEVHKTSADKTQQAMTARFSELEAQNRRLAAENNELRGTITSIQREVNSAVESASGMRSAHEAQLTVIHAFLCGLLGGGETGDIQLTLKELGARWKALQTAQSERSSLTAVEEAALRQELVVAESAHREELSRAVNAVEELRRAQDGKSGELRALASQLEATLRGRDDALGELEELRSRLALVQSSLETSEGVVADLWARLRGKHGEEDDWDTFEEALRSEMRAMRTAFEAKIKRLLEEADKARRKHRIELERSRALPR